jgi:hypothetical protein
MDALLLQNREAMGNNGSNVAVMYWFGCNDVVIT